MSLPEQLLLSDLLRRHVRCDQGIDHGVGAMVWMHPPVHRVLGWVSRPSSFGQRRLVWRLDQLRALVEQEALVKGDAAETDLPTVERLPTLIGSAVLDRQREPLGLMADAAFDPRSGRILHYLVSRSDPRLPGSSRWRLTPDRIVDQQPGQVFTALEALDDLPLARASVRQEWMRRSRRWRDQVQQAGDRFEQRLEGWLEEPPWQEPDDDDPASPWSERARSAEPWDDQWEEEEVPPRSRRRYAPEEEGDPWV